MGSGAVELHDCCDSCYFVLFCVTWGSRLSRSSFFRSPSPTPSCGEGSLPRTPSSSLRSWRLASPERTIVRTSLRSAPPEPGDLSSSLRSLRSPYLRFAPVGPPSVVWGSPEPRGATLHGSSVATPPRFARRRGDRGAVSWGLRPFTLLSSGSSLTSSFSFFEGLLIRPRRLRVGFRDEVPHGASLHGAFSPLIGKRFGRAVF